MMGIPANHPSISSAASVFLNFIPAAACGKRQEIIRGGHAS
jgi:hypothetical protein